MLRACDCGSWTAEDARNWNEEYGEALRAKVKLDQTEFSGVGSQLEIAVDDMAS
jgi:hypothetical protein